MIIVAKTEYQKTYFEEKEERKTENLAFIERFDVFTFVGLIRRGGGETAVAEISDAKIIGRNIRKNRKQKNLTQEALAFDADISTKMLSEYENGKHNIGQEALSKIADALYISVDELLPEHSRRIRGENTEEKKLLQLFRKMNASDRNMFMSMAERFAS